MSLPIPTWTRPPGPTWRLTRDEFERALTAAGLTDIEIIETHRVHEHAASAIIRARKPGRSANGSS